MDQPAKSELMPPLALLAGGLATRLRPLTETIPKSLVNVADEPFIGHQLRVLTREGVTEIVICTGHLGERIEAMGLPCTLFGRRRQATRYWRCSAARVALTR